jgi:protein-tyrosine phosphatase
VAGPSFSWITDELAIGGAIDEVQAALLAREHRITAVVDLRAEARDDAVLLRRQGIAFLHLPTTDVCGVSLPMLRRGVAFVSRHLDAGRRALVHCQHGIGRSALLGLCVLVARGRAPLDALALAKARRERVSPSPAQFEAWAAWLRRHKAAHARAWEVPSFDEFVAIAYRPSGAP